MEFKIKLTTGIPCESPLDNYNPGEGLDVVALTREDLDLPNLELRKIKVDSSCEWKDRSSFCVDNEMKCNVINAQKFSLTPNDLLVHQIPQFAARSECLIYVPPGYISRYYETIYDISYCNLSDLGENIISCLFKWSINFVFRRKTIKKVKVEYKFNKLEFLKDWVDGGFQTYWNVTKEHIDSEVEKYERECEEIRIKDAKEKEEKRLAKEAKARDQNRIRLKEYQEDLEMMSMRLKEICRRIFPEEK